MRLISAKKFLNWDSNWNSNWDSNWDRPKPCGRRLACLRSQKSQSPSKKHHFIKFSLPPLLPQKEGSFCYITRLKITEILRLIAFKARNIKDFNGLSFGLSKVSVYKKWAQFKEVRDDFFLCG